MATFTCYVPTNTLGKGFPPPSTFPFADGSVIELDFPQFYTLIGGSFFYPGGIPNGEVYTIDIYNYSDQLTRSWTAAVGSIYDAAVIYDLSRNGPWQDYFEYIFFLDDTIYGSAFNDKLGGYRGNDFLDGYQGNDKLKGGPGFDTFFFAAFDGRDTIKDFSVRKDTIMLDDSLANDIGDVFAAAFTYRRGVVLDFGSEEIKIKGLAPNQLGNVDFDFV